MKTNEERAIAIGKSRRLLRARLMEAKAVLHSSQRPLFSKNIFDFDAKALVSNDGKCALVWTVRRFPDLPEASDNQQTNVGTVSFVCNWHLR